MTDERRIFPIANAVFLINPFSGHVNPCLPVAKALSSSGDQVLFYSTPNFKNAVIQHGAQFRPYTNYRQMFNWKPKESAGFTEDLTFIYKKYAAVFSPLHVQIARQLADEMKETKPDYIIYDYFDGIWGKMASEMLNVPAISSVPTFAVCKKIYQLAPEEILRYVMLIDPEALKSSMNIPVQRLITIINVKISQDFNLKNFVLFEYGNSNILNIVYTSELFQPYSHLFDDRFVFIGNTSHQRQYSEYPQPPLRSTNTPRLFISLGTTQANQNIPFYRACIEAFSDTDYQIIMAIGSTSLRALGDIPANFYVGTHVDQLSVLQDTDVFITHGGMNSASEALIFGVPMLVCPQQGDQFAVAHRISELGAGCILQKEDITSINIRKAVQMLLSKPIYKKNSLKIGKTLRKKNDLAHLVQKIHAVI